jgi:hypothetical protein
MTQTATQTSEPQRLRALVRANEIRMARAGLKRRIAQGEVSAAEVLLNCPEEAKSWSLGDLLISQNRWGTTRCRKFLAPNRLVETKQIGTLTERQRVVLAESLEKIREAPPARPRAASGIKIAAPDEVAAPAEALVQVAITGPAELVKDVEVMESVELPVEVFAPTEVARSMERVLAVA